MPSVPYTERIQAARPRLSKSFQRLADYILDSYVQAALMTASELAHEVDVDAATVVRFAQALEYSGFPDLQVDIKARVLQDLLISPQEAAKPDSLAAQVDHSLTHLAESIERARRLLNPDLLDGLVQALAKSPRVLMLADARAQAAATALRRQLETVGILSVPVALEESALAGALSAARADDLFLVVDMAGESPLLAGALAQAKSFGLQTAAIVGAASFESARRAELVLEVQHQEAADTAGVVLAAMANALGDGLRWLMSEQSSTVAKKKTKAQKRLANGQKK